MRIHIMTCHGHRCLARARHAMCVRVYVCMFVCACACACVCAHVCVYVCMCVRVTCEGRTIITQGNTVGVKHGHDVEYDLLAKPLC